MEFRNALSFFLAWMFCAGAALAQPAPVASVPVDELGTWHGGHYIGFLPRHLEFERQRKQRQAERTSSARSVSDTPIPDVEEALARVSFEQTMPDPLPLGATREATGTVFASCRCPVCVDASPKVSVRADYLLWWTKEMDAPPLVTTSPESTGQGEAGVLGQSGTSILFGDGGLNGDSRSGGSITFSMWLDPAEMQGVDFSYLGLETETETFRATDGDFSIVARPFFNIINDAQDARLIAFPGLTQGSVSVSASTEFQAAEVVVRRIAERSETSDLFFVAGYRFSELEDSLRILESTRSLSGPTSGATFDLLDQFDTRNSFHGGELGLTYVGYAPHGWSMELNAKVAFGSTQAWARVFGQTTTTGVAGGVNTAPGGLLTQSTNLGEFEDDEFSTVSEFGVTLRRQLNCQWSATVGYRLLYWSDVLRAGEQMDLRINTSQIPPGTLSGEALPRSPLAMSEFWAQGLQFGLEYRF